MTSRRPSFAMLLAVGWLSALALTGAMLAGPVAAEPPASASAELQEKYPLRQSISCCPDSTPSVAGSVPPARPPGPDLGQDAWSPPRVVLAILFLLAGITLVLWVSALVPAIRGARLRPAGHGPPDMPDRRTRRLIWRPRPEHQVSPMVIRLARPMFRYSARLDAYVLRVVGARRGPVLVARDEGRPDESRPRRERMVSPALIRLSRPLYRYSARLDGYVLRLVGGRRGPILVPRDRPRRTLE